MTTSRKLHMISTKYFMSINWKHYVIYLQNMKFVQLILWPGGAYTDNTYATKLESGYHIRIHFMNHDYIGSFWQCQMNQKATRILGIIESQTATAFRRTLYLSEKDHSNDESIQALNPMDTVIQSPNRDTVGSQMALKPMGWIILSLQQRGPVAPQNAESKTEVKGKTGGRTPSPPLPHPPLSAKQEKN